jgi:vacuolar-type H+-ATPase subunit I/STV1
MAADYILFDGKNLSSLFKDIYDNQVNKKKNISEMIESLRKLIKNVGEAAVIAPIIKDLIEISVKNDDQLVKLATIAQRLSIAENKGVGEDGWLSDSEKKQLLQDMEQVVDEFAAKNEERLSDIQVDIEEIKTKI